MCHGVVRKDNDHIPIPWLIRLLWAFFGPVAGQLCAVQNKSHIPMYIHDIQNLCGYTRKYNNRKVFRQSEITTCTIAIYRIYGTAYDITRLVACLRVYIFPSWPLLVDSFCKFKLFAMSAEVPDQEFVIVLFFYAVFLIHFNFVFFKKTNFVCIV